MRQALRNVAMLIVAVGWAGAATAGDAEKQAKEMGERGGKKVTYVNDLIRLDDSQTMLGHLAMIKSDNEKVKEFGRTLSSDHRQHKTELIDWAETRAMEVSQVMKDMPGTGGTGELMKSEANKQFDAYEKNLAKADKKQAETFRKLRGLQGEAFDKEFIKVVLDDQKKGIKTVGDGMKTYREDVSFSAFLAKTEPVLKEHVQTAEEIKKSWY